MARAGCISALLLFLSAAAGAQTPSGFVGSNVCRGCHADIWQNFYKNPHYKSIASGTERPTAPGVKAAMAPPGLMWRRVAARIRFRTPSP